MVIEMDRWDEMQRRAGGGNPPSPLSQEGRVNKKGCRKFFRGRK